MSTIWEDPMNADEPLGVAQGIAPTGQPLDAAKYFTADANKGPTMKPERAETNQKLMERETDAVSAGKRQSARNARLWTIVLSASTATGDPRSASGDTAAAKRL